MDEAIGFGADYESVAGDEFVEKIFAGFGREGGGEEFGLRRKIGDEGAQGGDVIFLDVVAGEKAVALGEAFQAGAPEGLRFLWNETLPENDGAGAGFGTIAGEAEGEMDVGEGAEDFGGVEIVNAFGVAFVIAIAHEVLNRGELLFFAEIGDFRKALAVFAGFGFLEQTPGEKFSAVDFGVFGNDFLIPGIARGEK